MRLHCLATWVLLTTASLGLSVPASQAAGPPNIEGVWQVSQPMSTLKPLHGAVPFTAFGKKQYERNRHSQSRGDYQYDLTMSRCSSPGLPRLMLTARRFRVWQRPGMVAMAFEWNGLLRQIDLRGVETPVPLVTTMAGISKGHWESDTLVVRTDNLSERTLIDALVPHSENIVLTERIRLQQPNVLEDHMIIEDPAYFSRPWEAIVTYQRQPDAVFPEDVCLDRLKSGQPPLP